MQVNYLIKKLEDRLKDRPWFIILDRDGTLVSTTPDPDQAVVSSALRDLIHALAAESDVLIAILSARSCKQLRADFGSGRFILAGNYGLEIAFPERPAFIHPVASTAKSALVQAKKELLNLLPKNAQIILEDHGLSLCLHWHLTPAALQQSIHTTISQIKLCYPTLSFRSLPTSYEILPPVSWNKACALDEIKTQLSAKESSGLLYLYVGDSDADEPAFRWVNNHKGISIKVGKTTATEASFYLADPPAVLQFMEELLPLRKRSKT